MTLPPSSSKPAGIVAWAEPSKQPPSFARVRPRATGKRREGLRYEEAVEGYLEELYGEWYIPGPWFRFASNTSDRVRWCQPDGLVFDPVARTILIIESKLKHTTDAWWQLRHLYPQVLAALFPPSVWEIRVCEVVRWYDPAITFPERVALVPQPLAVGANEFGVHIWSPKG